MTLTIEEGKTYQTVGNGSIGPMFKRPDGSFAPAEWGSSGWQEDGTDCDRGDCQWRIIAEWPAEPEADIKAQIADEAKTIVSGARRSAYGTPEQNFERIARFWQAYFENTGRGAVAITAADVSPMMRLMKEARLAETPDHYDSFVDLIGYTLTGAEVNKTKKPT